MEQQSAEIESLKKLNELFALNWQDKNNPITSNTTIISIDSLDVCFENSKNILFSRLNDDLLNSPILAKYRAKQKVLEVEKRLKKEMIKPKLDVTYNFLSNNPNTYSPAFSNNSYKWGANFSFPLFLRNPINEYKIATLTAKNNNYDLSFKNNEIELKQKYLMQSISLILSQLTNAERSSKYSKILVEAEKLKFDNGESSLFMLNTRESKWLESELKLAELKLKFLKTIITLIHLKGNLNYEF